MKKERILMVSCEGLGKGGVQNVIMNIVEKLSDKYIFDILLFTSEERYYDKEFESYGGKIFRIPFYEGKSNFMKRVDYYIRAPYIYREAKKIMQENGPYRAIHCNNFYEAGILLKIAKDEDIPVRISHVHVVSEKKINKIRKFINKLYLKKILESATVCLACSKIAGQAFFKDNKFNVILNGYNDNKFKKIDKKRENNEFTLIQVANFGDNKNQLFTLKVFSEIVKKKINAKLIFVGEGDLVYRNKVKEEVKKIGLQENVKIYLADSNIPYLLHNADVFILPSKKEGFGIVLLEAQAMGKKCYVSNSVPLEPNVGGCKYLDLNDNAKVWANKIYKDYMSGNINKCNYDCSEFYIKNIVKKYEKIYENI